MELESSLPCSQEPAICPYALSFTYRNFFHPLTSVRFRPNCYANMTSTLFYCWSWMFQLLFRFLAAVDRRRRMQSEMTIDKIKETFAIWNMYSLLYAHKDLIKKQVYFNTFFVKNRNEEGALLLIFMELTNTITLFLLTQQRPVEQGLHIHEVSRSHTTTHHHRQDSSGRVISSSQTPLPDKTYQSQQTDIHALSGIRTHNFSTRVASDLLPGPCGHCDRHHNHSVVKIIYPLCLAVKRWTLQFRYHLSRKANFSFLSRVSYHC
jgi:hypothetical protein